MNIFYFRSLNVIGGVESFLYYLSKKYSDKDFIIYYQTGDFEQIKRISEYVRIKKYNGEKIKCDKAFFNYYHDIIPNVTANEYIQIIHADYKNRKFTPHPKITKYIGVSQLACDNFTAVSGLPCECYYNPIVVEKKKTLTLVSATRLTSEKGKSRIEKLGKMLNKAKIPYLWFVFTNDENPINNPNIIFMKPRLNITDYINMADYLVQLSDNEAYCYSVVEALCVGTPVIATKCSVFDEIGVKDGKNGFIVDFDLKNVPIDKIVKGLPEFEYTPPKDNYDKLLNGTSDYKKLKNTKVKVKPLVRYFDKELGRDVSKNTPPFETTLKRAYILQDLGFCKICT